MDWQITSTSATSSLPPPPPPPPPFSARRFHTSLKIAWISSCSNPPKQVTARSGASSDPRSRRPKNPPQEGRSKEGRGVGDELRHQKDSQDRRSRSHARRPSSRLRPLRRARAVCRRQGGMRGRSSGEEGRNCCSSGLGGLFLGSRL